MFLACMGWMGIYECGGGEVSGRGERRERETERVGGGRRTRGKKKFTLVAKRQVKSGTTWMK